ncbi:cytidine deaminase [Notoacmeibacter sp. MSK16QG-6]|uniref:cytidine deaminase n=1 Tax=Notoacmeibacter sp. MSK16QG-6 TaxID=2957982 RepID=UPI00209E84D4|nr:cytidine deaminase [Notoacmeibacter sp. MSK16QG-6]MCP1198193.1 cytidine deaminase [Notoacmeibacter sp. MSK16QG-6]
MAEGDKLFHLARKALERAHAPYSGFSVGAALRTKDGATFSGANMENVAFPEGWCAETSALAHMVMAGYSEPGCLAEVAVVAPKKDRITPCGGCRQRLAEFGTARTKIHLCDQTGIVETVRLGDLLPMAFSDLPSI